MSEFQINKEVYDVYGQMYLYAGEFNGKHMVQAIFEGNDGEESFGPVMEAPFQLADSEKKIRLGADSARLTELIAQQRRELQEIQSETNRARRERSEAQHQSAEILERLKQYPVLKRIDDILAGRMTHVVVAGYGAPEIMTTADISPVKNQYNRWDKDKAKLLTLYGASCGDLQFGLSSYSDGSGSSQQAWLFASEEEAKAKAAELMNANLREWLKSTHSYDFGGALRRAEQYGIALDADLHAQATERHKAASKKYNAEQIVKLELELQKHKKALEVLQ